MSPPTTRIDTAPTSPLRVLHLGKYYAPERGGIERTTQALAEWLVAHGVGVSALVHQRPGTWRGVRETLAGVDVRRSACIAAPIYTPISPAYPLDLANALREFEPDLLHLHLPNPSCFATLLSPRARRLPWIVHWHADVSPETPDWRLRAAYRFYRPFETALLRRAAAIVVTSQAYLDASVALAPWRSKTRVIALGIDEEPAAAGAVPRSWPQQTGLRLLAVGRLSHYKGFDVLIDALARTSNASLMLIGNGEEGDALRERARARGVDGRIDFAGALDDADVIAAYRNAGALVLPSLDRSEAFGMVLLEAMRAGLPVIASAIPGSGVGEVVVEGTTGVLVPPGDATALAAAIDRLARDSDECTRLGSAGQMRWRSEFTLDASAGRMLALYRELMNPSR